MDRRWQQHPERRRGATMIVLAALILIALTTPPLFATAAAQQIQRPARSGPWSDPNIWQAGRVPESNDAVLIPENTVVVLDVENVSVATLTISGARAVLSCPISSSNVTLSLTLATSLLVVENGACFSCTGSDGGDYCQQHDQQSELPLPFLGHLTIRLTSSIPPSSSNQDLRTLLVRDGGALYIVGRLRSPVITRLASHALAGASSIQVTDSRITNPSTGWQPGDLIAIAPTDYAPSQTEYRRVVAVAGSSSIELDRPLSYNHNGRRLDFPPRSETQQPPFTTTIDTRAEVALLTRSIIIEGLAKDPDGLGGDVRIQGRTSRAIFKNIELRYLGRRGHLGRYPLHIHGANGDQSLIDSVAIHDSYQRGVVLHCTSGAQVVNSIVASVPGFAFMLEDGAEENNVLIGNLALDVVNTLPNATSVATEHGNPAGFWFVNPSNLLADNMVAGVNGVAYAWEMLMNRTASYVLCPQDVPGYNVTLFDQRKYSDLDASVYGAMMRKNVVAFRNNSAHSMHSGLWFHGAGQLSAQSHYPPKQSPIDQFVAYKVAPRSSIAPGVEFVHHDACVHAFRTSRLKLLNMACVNSARVYWSDDANWLNGTVLAWVEDNDLLIPGDPSSNAKNNKDWQANVEALVSYHGPATFVNTRVALGNYARPIIRAMGQGSPGASRAIVRGVMYNATSNDDIALVASESPHVFTDEGGDWLGAGVGAHLLPSCPGCGSGPDPTIEAYAPGACKPIGVEVATTPTTLPSSSATNTDNQDQEYVSSPRQPTKGLIRGLGATPLLCAADATSPPPPPIAVVRLTLLASTQQQPPSLDFNIYAGLSIQQQFLRTATKQVEAQAAWFFVPMTPAAQSPMTSGGYRIVSPTGWAGIRTMVLTLGPMTVAERDGLTIVLANVPSEVTFSFVRGGLDIPGAGIVAASVAERCAENVTACATSSPTPCVCRDSATKDVYIRLFGTPGVMDPTVYNSDGELYLLQSPGVRLNWPEGETKAAAAAANQNNNDFTQLSQYLGAAPGG